MRNNQPDDDFRSLVGDIKPINNNDTVAPVRSKSPSLAQQQRRAALEAETKQHPADQLSEFVTDWVAPDDILSWRRGGLQDGVFRQLRRGQYEPGATLNLHQHTVTQARLAVAGFIQDCFERGIRTALVVHGRGLHSQPRPALLKSLCRQWLPELPPVLGLHSALPKHGGPGASYVIIKKNTAAKIANKEANRRR